MKLLLFFFAFALSSPSSDFTPVSESSEDESLRVRICWKGPKGNKTCITVSKVIGIRDADRDIMADAFMATDNSAMMLDLSNTNISSFRLAESAKLETCGSSLGLKQGTDIRVSNGFAVLR